SLLEFHLAPAREIGRTDEEKRTSRRPYDMSMRRPFRIVPLAAVAAVCATLAAHAQTALETPAPSVKAKVEQRVGITDFAVDYSSPGVKGRPIWGTLVPYNEMWRTGANAATKLTASKDFTFGDVKVPAGTYALLTIPTSGSWTVILNTKVD